MSGPDVSTWKHLHRASNADFYEIDSTALAVVPHPSSSDTEKSARESINFQREHWKRLGHKGACVVFLDAVLSQDREARAVYAKESGSTMNTCYVLIVDSFFGHAIAAVFTGLSRPPIPTQVFRNLEEARPWIDQMNRERGGPLS
jgi:hypothetical protein